MLAGTKRSCFVLKHVLRKLDKQFLSIMGFHVMPNPFYNYSYLFFKSCSAIIFIVVIYMYSIHKLFYIRIR